MKKRKGCIHIYTGDGKGKTTAALGLALRAWGQGMRVCIIQFLKGNKKTGEYKAIKKLGKNIIIRQFGTDRFVLKVTERDRELAQKGFAFAENMISSGEYDVVVLDEINCAINLKLIEKEQVKLLLENITCCVEVILTGRDAPRWLLKYSDLVTHMKALKHYYSKSQKARCGIEY